MILLIGGRSGLECVGSCRRFIHSSGDSVQCPVSWFRPSRGRGRRPSRFSFPGSKLFSSSQLDADQRCARTHARTHAACYPPPACSRSHSTHSLPLPSQSHSQNNNPPLFPILTT